VLRLGRKGDARAGVSTVAAPLQVDAQTSALPAGVPLRLRTVAASGRVVRQAFDGHAEDSG
jgi:hypothetical protein